MFAVATEVHRWRHYLLGRRLTIITDLSSLRQLTTQTIQTPKQQKWLVELLGFACIKYKLGLQNLVANALSRWSNNALMLALSSPIYHMKDKIQEAAQNDLNFQQLLNQVKSGLSSSLKLKLMDDLLF